MDRGDTTNRPPAGSESGRPGPSGRDVEHRSELARLLTKDRFPADPSTLTAELDAAGASPDLIGRVSRLPADHAFADVPEVLQALGINAPEQGGRR